MIPYITKYTNGTNTCSLIYDIHTDIVGAQLSKAQVADLLQLGAQHNTVFVVEDMWDYRGTDQQMQQILTTVQEATGKGCLLMPMINQQLIEYSGMSGLVAACTAANIPVSNPEFRQNFIMNVFYAAQGKIPQALEAFHNLLHDFEQVKTEIGGYNDTPVLNSYYQKTAAEVAPALAYLHEHANKALNSAQTEQFLNYLWDCMITLFDARMAHTWYQQSLMHPHVVVYMGGEHAASLNELLPQLGYNQVAEYGNPDIVGYVQAYRYYVHAHQPERSSSLMTKLKNMWRTWQLNRAQNACAKQYLAALDVAKKVDVKKLF